MCGRTQLCPPRGTVRQVAAGPDSSTAGSESDSLTSHSQTIYLDRQAGSRAVALVGRLDRYWGQITVRSSLGILKTELAIRLERTLREDVGSSYGFQSSFPRRNGAAPVVLTGSVHKLDTK